MSSHNLTITICSLLFSVMPTDSASFETLFSEHNKLKNKMIIDIGNVKEVNPPYDTQWSSKVYVMNSRCFTSPGILSIFSNESAMIVYGKDKLVELATFEKTISDIKVDLNYIQLIECPESALITPSCDGLTTDECRKILNTYERKLKRSLEMLNK